MKAFLLREVELLGVYVLGSDTDDIEHAERVGHEGRGTADEELVSAGLLCSGENDGHELDADLARVARPPARGPAQHLGHLEVELEPQLC